MSNLLNKNSQMKKFMTFTLLFIVIYEVFKWFKYIIDIIYIQIRTNVWVFDMFQIICWTFIILFIVALTKLKKSRNSLYFKIIGILYFIYKIYTIYGLINISIYFLKYENEIASFFFIFVIHGNLKIFFICILPFLILDSACMILVVFFIIFSFKKSDSDEVFNNDQYESLS